MCTKIFKRDILASILENENESISLGEDIDGVVIANGNWKVKRQMVAYLQEIGVSDNKIIV